MYCPKCGLRITDNARYCSNCGTDLMLEGGEQSYVEVVIGEHAGFWRRFVAWIIDGIIVGIVYYSLQYLCHWVGAAPFPT